MLNPGQRLGPYEIESPLGAGGMGEVYRARDTRLDRTVAVKVLPAHLSQDASAKQRFDREARAVSSVTHAHICTLHDVGHDDASDTDYLVMEFLEGETLAHRLARGPLPTEQLLRYAVEICDGLERAHRSGVVHRDLKPANIMLTKSGAKLMDFGLAKPTRSAVAATGSSAPTMQHPLTGEGTIVGTFQYMAPEQIEGRDADARSDIFSLGAVLYEMATGKPAFAGKTTASVLAAVLEREPDPISTAAPMSPPALDEVVKACMAKDPDERLQTAHDVKLQLKWIQTASTSRTGIPAVISHRRKNREHLAWAVALLGTALAIAAVADFVWNRTADPVTISQIVLPAGYTLNAIGDISGAPVISPDGRHVVFYASGASGSRLYLRDLDSPAISPLSGTENGLFPFWSPDSQSVGFFADGKLKRTDIRGGSTVALCDAPNGRGGSWGKNGVILFTPHFSNAGIWTVSADGGAATELLKLAPAFTTYRWPQWLPDEKRFLFFAGNHDRSEGSDIGIYIATADGKSAREVVTSESSAQFVAGELLYLRSDALVAQPFDPSSAKLTGEAKVLDSGVQLDASIFRSDFSASSQGTLLYVSGGDHSQLQLSWRDLNGKDAGSVSTPDEFWQVRLSPDDKLAATVMGNKVKQIYIYDLEHKTRNRLTYNDETFYASPVWSPDGKQIVYAYEDEKNNDFIVARDASGAGSERQLWAGTAGSRGLGINVEIGDWSRDGKFLVFAQGSLSDDRRLWVLPLTGPEQGKAFRYGPDASTQTQPRFSPDGKWIAYNSLETGHNEIYIAPFPWTGARFQVSSNEGIDAQWSPDGKTLYYQPLSNAGVSAVSLSFVGTGVQVGQARPLFHASTTLGLQGMEYSPAHDGKRLLTISGTEDENANSAIFLVQNWQAQLQKK